MTDAIPDVPKPDDPTADQRDVLHPERDAEDIADDELPLDPAGPTELGGAVDG